MFPGRIAAMLDARPPFPVSEEQSVVRHSVLLVLLLVPAPAMALGAEDVRFYGKLGNGELVRIGFLDDPQPWTGNAFLYGSPTPAAFRYCWGHAVDETPVSFECTSERGGAPTLIYKAVAPATGKPTAEYRAIARKAKLGDGSRRGDGTLLHVYECAVGCLPALPRRLFEVGMFD